MDVSSILSKFKANKNPNEFVFPVTAYTEFLKTASKSVNFKGDIHVKPLFPEFLQTIETDKQIASISTDDYTASYLPGEALRLFLETGNLPIKKRSEYTERDVEMSLEMLVDIFLSMHRDLNKAQIMRCRRNMIKRLFHMEPHQYQIKLYNFAEEGHSFFAPQ
jgi:hypothetical protein